MSLSVWVSHTVVLLLSDAPFVSLFIHSCTCLFVSLSVTETSVLKSCLIIESSSQFVLSVFAFVTDAILFGNSISYACLLLVSISLNHLFPTLHCQCEVSFWQAAYNEILFLWFLILFVQLKSFGS